MMYLQREVSKPLQIQRNFIFISCVTILYFCLQGYILYKINQPYSGVLISKTDSATYTIAKIKSSGWAFHTDLKEGDIIYSINKEKPHLGILPGYQNQSLNASEIQVKKMISPKLIKEHNISLIMVTKSFLYTSLPTRFYLFRVIYFSLYKEAFEPGKILFDHVSIHDFLKSSNCS